MSMFAGLDVDTSIKVQEDRIGGARFDETGFSVCKITKAFAGQSSGGAYSVTLHLQRKDGAKTVVTEYITSGTAKGCKNYYLDKSGNKQYLPGYNKIKSLDALLGFERGYPSTTAGNVMLWDKDLGKEIPQPKEVITDWVGKEIGILGKIFVEDKTVKNEATGAYEPIAEFRKGFEVEHFVDAISGLTRNEKTAGDTGFKDKWLNAFKPDFIKDTRVASKHLDLNAPQASSGTSTPAQPNPITDEENPF